MKGLRGNRLMMMRGDLPSGRRTVNIRVIILLYIRDITAPGPVKASLDNGLDRGRGGRLPRRMQNG